MSKKVLFSSQRVIVTSLSMATNPTPLAGSVTQIQSFNIGDLCNNGMASVVALTHGDAAGSVVQSLNVANIQSSPCMATPCFNLGLL